MADWNIFGHEMAKNILNKQLVANNFPHAYLFFGPDGVGKKTLAQEFAKKILQTENLSTHPDFLIFDSEAEITAEQMQDFSQKLFFKPFAGHYKVAVLNNAHKLNKTSGNALLKTLEEPPKSTIIILVASGPVLPTIISRCQVLQFSSLSRSSLAGFASSLNLSCTPEQAALAFGSPARLIRLLQEKDFYASQNDEVSGFQKFKRKTLGKKMAALPGLAELEPEELRQKLIFWAFCQIEDLKNAPQDFGKAEAILEAAKGLEQNFNKKLVLQGLFLKL